MHRAKGERELTEISKLEFFSSERNTAAEPQSESCNYLTYVVCPDVKKALQFGTGSFYDPQALLPFVERAAILARTFIGELSNAYSRKSSASADQGPLPHRGRFWHPDTRLA